VTRVKLIETHHRRQRPVCRRRRPGRPDARKRYHVRRWTTQPRREVAEISHADRIPRQAPTSEELAEQLQVMRVGAHRIRGALDPMQIPQELRRSDHLAAIRAEHRPRLPPIRQRDPMGDMRGSQTRIDR
jgi:hypothetical protein